MTVKRQHQPRRSITRSKLRHHRRSTRFSVVRSADTANVSLRSHVKEKGCADVGYFDPPWSMGRTTPAHGVGSVSPEHHYPTMSPQALREFVFGEAFNKDAVIGFWVLNGQLELALDMLRGQGFKLKTIVTWHKVRSKGGNAYLPASGPVRNCSEMMIIAARGRGLPINREAEKFSSIVTIERSEHSAKPAFFREMLARLYPLTWSGRRTVKLEGFARDRKRGWNVWGNQAPKKMGGKRRALRRVS